jgi:uncharacterized delta-60 repeat protein
MVLSVAVPVCTAMPAAPAAAANGVLDPSFGLAGFSTTAFGAWAGAAADVVQPNGYVVTAGETDVNGTYEMIATRDTPNGQLDPGFGAGGIVTVDIGGNSAVDSGYALALQPDGKIVIAGQGYSRNQGEFAVVRLNPDGSFDSTFGRGGISMIPIGDSAYATSVLVGPGGDIDVGGIAQTTGVNHFALARLRPNGTLEKRFDSGGVILLPGYAAAWGMASEPDGSIVLAGQALVQNVQRFIAARILPSGGLDPSFGGDGIVTVPIGSGAVGYALAIQRDGKILIGGNAVSANGTPLAAIVRLNRDGSLDPTFASNGLLQFPGGGLNMMTVDAAGRIYLAGVGATLIRLNPNGTVDTTFAHDGFGLYCDGINCAANGIAIDPTTGDPVLAGIATVLGRPEVMTIRLSP